jgi:hypothetical protein
VSAGAAVVVAAALAVAGVAMWRGNTSHPAAAPSASATHRPAETRTATPAPTPTRSGPAANTASYDLAALPDLDVYSVNPQLPVDPDPGGTMTNLVARAASAEIPVFADPASAPAAPPVAKLAQAPRESSGAFPVVAQYTDWVEVLLVGRQGVPPAGNSHQTIGWLRRADVQLASNDTHIEVNLTQHSIDIVTGASATHVTSDFAWGTAATPTPIGRTFVMEVAVNPSLGYTRGHPIVYLATQSGTLAGFDGGSVAVTAIHYYDVHQGAISNGCIRVDAAAIETLDKVPPGTVVYIKN